ncbi:MAG TPA: hypothetical protein V6C65_36205 [Allocoleopsis sp.]
MESIAVLLIVMGLIFEGLALSGRANIATFLNFEFDRTGRLTSGTVGTVLLTAGLLVLLKNSPPPPYAPTPVPSAVTPLPTSPPVPPYDPPAPPPTDTTFRPSNIDGIWHLQWQVDLTNYESILYVSGDTGIMETVVSDVSGYVAIDQTMQRSPTEEGFVLRGSNPVFAATQLPVTGYSPDNLWFEIQPNGSIEHIHMCDNQSACAPAAFEFLGTNVQ